MRSTETYHNEDKYQSAVMAVILRLYSV